MEMDKIVISAELLTQRFNVPWKTILNGINRSSSGKTSSWIGWKEGKSYKIILSSIPPSTLKKIKCIDTLEKIISDVSVENQVNQILFINRYLSIELDISINNEATWRKYLPEISYLSCETDYKIKVARKFSLWNKILNLNKQGFDKKEIFHAAIERLPDFLKIRSYTYFCERLNLAEDEGIKFVVIHGSLGRKFPQRTKFSSWHARQVKRLYCDKRILTIATIFRELKHLSLIAGQLEVSYSTVQTFLSDPEIRNSLDPIRYGQAYAHNNLYPHIIREDPADSDDLWQADGTSLQFFSTDMNGKIYRPVIFMFIDVYSRKILGYSLGETETTELVLSALKSTLIGCHKLPHELVADSGSAIKSKAFTNFIQTANEITHLEFRSHQPHNPRDKGHIEKLFGTLQTKYFRTYRGYIGEGILSNHKKNHIPKEIKREFSKNALQFNELKILVDRVIHNYNNDLNKAGHSPNSIYRNGKSRNATKIADHDILRLINEPLGDKKVHRGQLLLQKGKRKFQYILDPELGRVINDQNVFVYRPYNSNDEIHIFDKYLRFLKTISKTNPIKTTGPGKKNSLSQIKKVSDIEKSYLKYARKQYADLLSETGS